jgi:superfamily II DNA or RNA helicase
MAELVIRRERDVLPQSLRFGSIRRRIVRHPVPHISEIDALQFPLVEGRRDLMRRVLWRRLESSSAALLESVRRQTRFYERALDSLRGGRTLTKREYRRAFGDEEDRDALQEVLFWDVFAPDEARIDAEIIRDELRRLDAIRAAALATPNAKRDLLAEVIGQNPALVFTSAIATAHDVARALGAGVLTSREAIPIDAIAAFRRGCIDVMVCTDLASEGLNLQRAGTVVHYDIPWNPVKLDQRNGRAWRIGQTRSEIEAIYFFPQSRRTRIVETIASKNRARRRLLRPSNPLAARTLAALPPHMPRDAAAAQLLKRLRDAPSQLGRRYPAGIERLFAELASEYLDDRRLAELLALLPV